MSVKRLKTDEIAEHFIEIRDLIRAYCKSEDMGLSPTQIFQEFMAAAALELVLVSEDEEGQLTGFALALPIHFKGTPALSLCHAFNSAGDDAYKEGFEAFLEIAKEHKIALMTCETPIGRRWDVYAKRWLQPMGFEPVATVFVKEVDHGE